MLRNVGDEMNSSLVPIQWKSSLLSATEWHSIFRRRQLGVQEAHLLSCPLVGGGRPAGATGAVATQRPQATTDNEQTPKNQTTTARPPPDRPAPPHTPPAPHFLRGRRGPPPPGMGARTLLHVLWIVVVFNLVCVGLDAVQTDFQCKYACSSSQQGY
jgi:hypothetical protein